jgi:hypothetical protein
LVVAVFGLGCAPKIEVAPAEAPGVTLLELSTTGVAAGDRAAVTAAMQTAPVKPCFEALLAHSPRASGEVVVDFTISSSGIVESARPSFGTLGDAEAESCVAGAVQSVVFPARATPLSVRYPFLLITERTPPEVARALKDRYGLLPKNDLDPGGDPRTPPPPGIVVVW